MIITLAATELDQEYLSLRRHDAKPISVDFSRVLVNKPWGQEYLFLKNNSVEIWSLFINRHNGTSMHCHPNKKTSLIVLEGRAIFSSLNTSMELSPMDVVIIAPGAFHSTLSISQKGTGVLELETPPMKHDLFRLEDKYGRADTGYEGSEKMILDGGHARFAQKELNVTKNIFNKKIRLHSVKTPDDLKALATVKKKAIIAVLGGNILSKNGQIIYGVGDIFSLKDLLKNGVNWKLKNAKFISIQEA